MQKVTRCDVEAIAQLLTGQHALIRVMSVLIAFLFWFSAAMGIFVLYYMRILPAQRLLSLGQMYTVIGVSPFALAAASWKILEKLLHAYIRRYVEKYCFQGS